MPNLKKARQRAALPLAAARRSAEPAKLRRCTRTAAALLPATRALPARACMSASCCCWVGTEGWVRLGERITSEVPDKLALVGC